MPPELDAVAEPIAKGMGLLHRIEKSGGAVLDGRDDVLAIVRSVLDRLQKLPTGGVVDDVTDAVASSLSNVHALVKYQPTRAAVQHAPPPAQPAPAAAPAPVAAPPPVVAQPAASMQKATAQAAPSKAVVVEVELGTHSASNFYKGLSGNDVIDHGGVFVATYKVPRPGTQLTLNVHMPGSFEFQAAGVVQWTREGGDGVDPGYGAKFTSIAPEARQLVYRYTRNREPMFYDDM